MPSIKFFLKFGILGTFTLALLFFSGPFARAQSFVEPVALAQAGIETPTAEALPLEVAETPVLTTTATVTPTTTVVPTETLTPTATVESTVTGLVGRRWVYLPSIYRQPNIPDGPPQRVRFCSNQAASIPDNNLGGVSTTIVINDPRLIHDLDVQLDIEHTWLGDLGARLTHVETGSSIKLMNRPVEPATGKRCKYDNVKGILDDEMAAPVDGQCAAYPAAVSGIYLPTEPLSAFDGEFVQGSWTLTVTDEDVLEVGQLKNWCLTATIGGLVPQTPPPPQVNLPARAQITGVYAESQRLPLDCESRVAVDWAWFFGYYIGEFDFFYSLPTSDNPDLGFVGNVNGQWGQIPPNPYGVHAGPVAKVLREKYGVPAYAHTPLRWDDLRAEIAAGRPVYVWTVGPGDRNGIPVYYTSSDGHMSIVARYEHVVMVTGYSESEVLVKDGSHPTLHIPLNQFLSSWSALGNMAITTQP